jgi:hypothetical protein
MGDGTTILKKIIRENTTEFLQKSTNGLKWDIRPVTGLYDTFTGASITAMPFHPALARISTSNW